MSSKKSKALYELNRELERCRSQSKAIIYTIVGNYAELVEGDYEWSPALEYVKLLKRRNEELIKKIDVLQTQISLLERFKNVTTHESTGRINETSKSETKNEIEPE